MVTLSSSSRRYPYRVYKGHRKVKRCSKHSKPRSSSKYLYDNRGSQSKSNRYRKSLSRSYSKNSYRPLSGTKKTKRDSRRHRFRGKGTSNRRTRQRVKRRRRTRNHTGSLTKQAEMPQDCSEQENADTTELKSNTPVNDSTNDGETVRSVQTDENMPNALAMDSKDQGAKTQNASVGTIE
ncbi:Hypothetical predicted protein [Octopus vulgaris]|uniref:Uncharacterized protein n=1 Tax=Octopus vulgaris TaxID=6645 RepID=A0AA36AJL6_OCTVU|nr:Hypothetical predicted protein [Octopus vulgaris]